jgi:3-isopropylmalate/(R)-2-methylmalate dehydratase small subunit
VKPVRQVHGRVAVLDRADVDTDQIMPKQFLKRIERTGYGEFLFWDWRRQDPEFELNRPENAGARILVTGRNFGCGSSREHAVWGLQEYGFDAVVAPSFGEIFFPNCLKNGLLPVRLEADVVRELHREPQLTIDLESCRITTASGRTIDFDFDPFQRHRLLNGLDDISLTLQHEAAIADFETLRTDRIDTTALEEQWSAPTGPNTRGPRLPP